MVMKFSTNAPPINSAKLPENLRKFSCPEIFLSPQIPLHNLLLILDNGEPVLISMRGKGEY